MTTPADKKFHKVMREFSKGKLRSSDGKRVIDKSQALAIAFSEARKRDKKYKLQRFENGTKIKADTTLQLIFEDAWQKYIDYLASSSGKPKPFAEWLRTDETGLKYNKRMSQIIRDETKINDNPVLNERGTKISNNEQHGGGKLSGAYHTNGGIRAVIKETGKPVEVENEELIVTKGVAQSEDVVTCTGKPEAVVSRLNESYGGDKISDKPAFCSIVKKHIMEKGAKIENEKYKVVKIFRNSGNRKVLEKNLSIEEAKRVVNSYPNSEKHMVVFTKMKHGAKINDYELSWVEVIFENPKYNYETSVSKNTDEENVREYFVGKSFDVGKYPNENIQKVVDIKFHPSEKMETGNKIKSHLNESSIKRMIIRNNELKRADNGIKIVEKEPEQEYVLITEPEVFAIMQFIDGQFKFPKDSSVVNFDFRGNEVLIYENYGDESNMIKFLNKYGIHYKIFESKDELIREYLMKFIPSHRRKQFGIEMESGKIVLNKT